MTLGDNKGEYVPFVFMSDEPTLGYVARNDVEAAIERHLRAALDKAKEKFVAEMVEKFKRDYGL